MTVKRCVRCDAKPIKETANYKEERSRPLNRGFYASERKFGPFTAYSIRCRNCGLAITGQDSWTIATHTWNRLKSWEVGRVAGRN